MLRVRRDGGYPRRDDEYGGGGVCAARWRELSRNKSRDEREMWPNRTAHTDTVFPDGGGGGGKKEETAAVALRHITSLIPSRFALIALWRFAVGIFDVTTVRRRGCDSDCERRPRPKASPYGSTRDVPRDSCG